MSGFYGDKSRILSPIRCGSGFKGPFHLSLFVPGGQIGLSKGTKHHVFEHFLCVLIRREARHRAVLRPFVPCFRFPGTNLSPFCPLGDKFLFRGQMEGAKGTKYHIKDCVFHLFIRREVRFRADL